MWTWTHSKKLAKNMMATHSHPLLMSLGSKRSLDSMSTNASGSEDDMSHGLPAIEFMDALQDSPRFRESLQSHEADLEKTSKEIKDLIKEFETVVDAELNLSAMRRNLANKMMQFRLDGIGNKCTDDENMIMGSLKEFGQFINDIEDERDRMFENASESFIMPLRNFRKEHLSAVMEEKKNFDKQTKDFYSNQERHLALSHKKPENVLKEEDGNLAIEQRNFVKSGLKYTCLIQEVQERKKFEFVERIQMLMQSWFTFYHHGHDKAKDLQAFMTDLQMTLQNARENFDSKSDLNTDVGIQGGIRSLMTQTSGIYEENFKRTKSRRSMTMAFRRDGRRSSIHELVKPTINSFVQPILPGLEQVDPGILNKEYTRAGTVYLLKNGVWKRCFCQYTKESKMIWLSSYNPSQGEIFTQQVFTLQKCREHKKNEGDRRFCIYLTSSNKEKYTIQTQSQLDCNRWIETMDCNQPLIDQKNARRVSNMETAFLDEAGINFVKKCIKQLEGRGLEDEGLYRTGGVISKVDNLLKSGLNGEESDNLDLDDPVEWQTNTITSAIKKFFRNMLEPLMTYILHTKFINAAKLDTKEIRLKEILRLVDLLPASNRAMLEMLLQHLARVVEKSDKNRMTASNLGVCFGPTLLWSEEITVAAILDNKFGNVVVETLIQNWEIVLKKKQESMETA